MAATSAKSVADSSGKNVDNFHCVIEKLLKTSFSSFSFTEKLKIVNDGPPRQVLNITTKLNSCVRHFNDKIYESEHWICGCEVTNKLYCWACLLFSREKCIWNDNGYSDLNNIYKSSKRHKDSTVHIKCEKELVMFGKNQRIEFSLSELNNISIEKHNEVVRQNREILGYLISITCFLGKLGLPFNGRHGKSSINNGYFMEMLNEFSMRNCVLKTHLEKSSMIRGNFLSIQNDLILSVTEVMTQKIKRELLEASFVALILDECYGDVDIKPQLATVLRYVKKDGVVQERFLNFTHVNCDKSANALLKHTIKITKEFNCGKMLVAQTYDGAAVMACEHKDLQAKILEHFAATAFIHCYAHDLSLVLSQSASCIKQVKTFFTNIAGFSSFFSNSSKRKHALDPYLKRVTSSPTKWWSFPSRIVDTINEHKVDLERIFVSVVINEDGEWDSQTVVCARGLFSVLRDFEFNFLLTLFALVFPPTDILFEKLQSNRADTVHCNKEIKVFKKYMEKLKNDFESVWERTNESIAEFDTQPKISKNAITGEDEKTAYKSLFNEILDVIRIIISNRFCENSRLQFMRLVDPTMFSCFANSSPEESFSSLKKTYGDYFDLLRLKNELGVIYKDLDMRRSNESDLHRYIKSLQLSTIFSETNKLIELVLTIPAAGVATAEKSCSYLKRIKNFLRSAQDDENLSALALMNIECCLLENLQSIPQFQEEVIARFAKKQRQIDLEFKRPPFELVECGEEPTMGFEQPKSDRQQSILESILEKPKTIGRNTNRTPLEKKRKRKDDKTIRTSNGDVTGQDEHAKTVSAVDITQLRKEVQEVLNKKLCVDQQNDVGGVSSSSSEQFAEVLIKEEVTLIDAPMTRNVFGEEEEELPLVEIKQETIVFGDECNPLGTADIQES